MPPDQKAARNADGWIVLVLVAAGFFRGLLCEPSPGGQIECQLLGPCDGKVGVVAPVARHRVDRPHGWNPILHVGGEPRLVHDAGVFVAQPVAKEAAQLVEVIDPRAGE